MKKTLIASAVALATFTNFAFAEDVTAEQDLASDLAARMDGMPTVYGNIQLAWAYTDNDEAGSNTTGMADNGSTIGLKHSHEITPGLEGFLKIELDGFGADDKTNSAGRIRLDEAYIGLRGGFGEVWAGSDDSVYERLIDGISQYYEYAALNTGLGYSTGEGDLVQYMSPSFGGFTLHGAVQVDSSQDPEGGVETGGDYPFQLGAQYAVDNLSLSFAMDSNDRVRYTRFEDLGGEEPVQVAAITPGNSYGVRGAFALGELELSAMYSTQTDVRDDYGLMAIYSMGANTFAISYEYSEADGDAAVALLEYEESSVISLQALHSLSDNMYIWSELYFVSNDGDFIDSDLDNGGNSTGFSFDADADTTQLAIGAVYVF